MPALMETHRAERDEPGYPWPSWLKLAAVRSRAQLEKITQVSKDCAIAELVVGPAACGHPVVGVSPPPPPQILLEWSRLPCPAVRASYLVPHMASGQVLCGLVGPTA